MTYNYIAAYITRRDKYPVSFFAHSGDLIHPINNESDLLDLIIETCDTEEAAVVKTLLRYEDYLEDRFNITNNLIKSIYD